MKKLFVIILGILFLSSCQSILKRMAGVPSKVFPMTDTEVVMLIDEYNIPYDKIYRPKKDFFNEHINYVEEKIGRINYACVFDAQSQKILMSSTENDCAFKVISAIQKNNFSTQDVGIDVSLIDFLQGCNLIESNKMKDLNQDYKYILVYSYASHYGKSYLKGLSEMQKYSDDNRLNLKIYALNYDLFID